jgi:hypothetical protein
MRSRVRPAGVRWGLVVGVALLHAGHSVEVRAQQADDPVSASQFRLGPLGINAGGWFTAGYDSNLTREADAVVSGPSFHASPQLQLWTRMGRLFVGATGALEYLQVAGLQDVTLTGQPKANLLGAATAQMNGPRLSWLVDASYKDTNARPTGFEIGARSRHQERLLRASGSVALSPRIKVALDGSALRVGYDADAIYRESLLHKTLNRDSDSVGLSGYVSITPITSLFAAAEWRTEVYRNAPERDNRSRYVLGGLSFAPGGLLSGSAAFGYRFSRGATEPTSPLTGAVANVRLLVRGPSGDLLAIGAVQDRLFSFDDRQGAFTSRGIELSGISRPLLGWNIFFASSFFRLEYTEPVERNERHIEYQVGSSRQLRPLFRLGILAHRFVHSARRGTGQQYDGTRVVGFVMFGMRSWWRQLDLPLPPF